MADWNDENKAALVKEYEDANPTPETSSEIVAELAPKYDATVNGARMILVRANVYIAKGKVTAKTGTSSGSSEKKETKQESLDRLTAIIEAQALEADDTVISKLTGKAAAYFADIIRDATNEDRED